MYVCMYVCIYGNQDSVKNLPKELLKFKKNPVSRGGPIRRLQCMYVQYILHTYIHTSCMKIEVE